MNIYEKHRLKDGKLPFIFHDYRRKKDHRDVRGNWHENLELLYVIKGKAQVTSNEEKGVISEGEVAVINSNYIHFVQALEDLRFVVLIVDRSFCISNHFDTSAITFKLHICDNEISALFKEIAENYENESLPYRVTVMRSRILTVLSLLLTRHIDSSATSGKESNLLSAIKQALGYIHTEYASHLSLDEVASVAGISKYYFAREFLRVTGLSFITYLNAFRCEKAKILLLEGKCNIESVAYSVGFASASYFNRIFKKVVGMSPSDYIVSKQQA